MAKTPAIPTKVRPAHDAIAALIEPLCAERLNEDYRELCLDMLGILARMRPSPLLTGKPAGWACGIVRAIGWINFLDDPDQTPHMKSAEVDAYFGVSQATGQSRSKRIRDLFDTGPLDPEWTLPSRLIENPMVWMIEVNGFVMDARRAPRAIQERAFELGLIPFVPDDKTEK